MDLKKLEVFINAVDLGSLTKVAEVMGYTQSGITHMISGLEKELGFSLLVRSRNGVVPTAEGTRVIPIIRAMLIHSDKLEKEASMIRQKKNTSIRLCAYTSMLMHWLPFIVRKFHEKYPDVAIEMTSCTLEETYEKVENGEVDLSFASRQNYQGFEFIHLRDDPLVAVLPETEENKKLSCFPLKEFDEKDFIMPYYGFEKDIVHLFESDNVQPKIEPAYVDDPTVIFMVEHGMGISMLSELIMRGNKNNVVALPLFPAAHRELVICMKSVKNAPPIVKEFVACAKETIDEIYSKS
ncbi:MAG: LysR family transcriptional regulator [Clostridia bacterium]|nr:LysR family transcriptional regulator [Clostridia bacterium]